MNYSELDLIFIFSVLNFYLFLFCHFVISLFYRKINLENKISFFIFYLKYFNENEKFCLDKLIK